MDAVHILTCSLKQWTNYSQAVHTDLFLEAVDALFASGPYWPVPWNSGRVIHKRFILTCSLKQWKSYAQAVDTDLFLEAVDELFTSRPYWTVPFKQWTNYSQMVQLLTKWWMNSNVTIRRLCKFFILIISWRINCNNSILIKTTCQCNVPSSGARAALGSGFPISRTQRVYSYDLCAHKLTRGKRRNFTTRG